MADTTRLSDGWWAEGTLAIARPVNTLIRNTADGEIYASTDASVPAYAQLTNSGGGGGPGIGVNVTLISGGTATTFGTITAALASAIPGDTVLVGSGIYAESITIPSGVLVVGFPTAQNVIISGADATSTRVQLNDTSTLRACTIVAPSSGANPAIDVNLAPGELATVFGVVVQGAGGSGALLRQQGTGIVAILDGLYHNSGATAGPFIQMDGGKMILQQVIANGGACSDILLLHAGVVRAGFLLVQDSTLYSATDGIHISGGQLELSTYQSPLTNSAVMNALHVDADNVKVSISDAVLVGSTFDILVDGAATGAGTDIILTACQLSLERIFAPPAWFPLLAKGLATFTDAGVLNDPAFRVDTELAVGIPERPSESALGEGDSNVLGMTVLSDDGLGGFVDNTTAAASSDNSTFSVFQGTALNNAAYFGHQSRQFSGLKVDGAGTAIALGAGALTWEYWNGVAWTAFNIMVSDADAPYLQKAQVAFDITTTSDQIRFDGGSINGSWAMTTVNGTAAYWVRCRISTGPITMVPVLERVKLGTNRTEINKDGFVEFFGLAEPERLLPNVSLATVQDLEGASPSNRAIQYSAGIALTPRDNAFKDTALDGFGIQIAVPSALDTSRKLTLRVEWRPENNTAGDVTLEMLHVRIPALGVVLIDGSLPETSQILVETVAINTQDQRYVVEFPLDLSDFSAGDGLVLALQRDATGGNPADTYAGAVEIFSLDLRGYFWR